MGWYSAPEGADKRMYFFLLILTLGNTVGYQGWSLLFTNFAVDVGRLNAADNGFVQSLRELPGLLGFTILPLLLIIKEHRMAALAVLATGLGTALTGLSPSFIGLLCATLLMSFGFHYFEVVNQSLTLQYFDLRSTPLVMGRLRGLAAGGSLIASILVFTLADSVSFALMFSFFGGFCILTGLWALWQNPSDITKPKQRSAIIFRKKYWLFYALTFVSGARRQIFLVFGLFLLVEHFNLGVRTIALIFICNYAINWVLNPLIGRMINAFGERVIISLEYSASFFVFMGYAFTDSALLASILFIVDFIFFNFTIALRTFFQKIADPEDIAPSMALGQTINHICAVIVPALGGYAWVTIGYQAPFFAAMGLTVFSLALAQCVTWQLRLHQKILL